MEGLNFIPSAHFSPFSSLSANIASKLYLSPVCLMGKLTS